MILAGDIGGTKTLLASFQQTDFGWECKQRQLFQSGEYKSFNQILDEFIESDSSINIQAACIGVAGPVLNGNCDTTNLPWSLKTAEIRTILKTSRVKLLNDLEATAWGVHSQQQKDIVELNPDAEKSTGNIAVLAAGTGLGEAIICWDGEEYHVMASEGGHTDFAPNSAQEIALLEFLNRKYPEHVSYERLVSGEGLYNIYQFLRDCGTDQQNNEIERQIKTGDPAAIIGQAAISGHDLLCEEALNLFCKMYGAEAGNLALKCLPYGGVYLAGGIAAKILPFLQNGSFIQAFLGKGRYKNILQKIPVRVCLNSDVALSGALNCALKMID